MNPFLWTSKEKDFVVADETAIKCNIAAGDSRYFKEKIHNNHGHFEFVGWNELVKPNNFIESPSGTFYLGRQSAPHAGDFLLHDQKKVTKEKAARRRRSANAESPALLAVPGVRLTRA